MQLKTILQKYEFPTACQYNVQTEGGSKLSGSADVSPEEPPTWTNKQMIDYAEWAMNYRISNG